MAKRKATQSRVSISARDDPTTRFAKEVVLGKVLAGPDVRAACKRHLDDLKAPKKRHIRFNAKAAKRALDFFPDVLTVEVEGRIVPFTLLPAWVFVIGSLFGWQRREDRIWVRRFDRAYVEAGKGPLALDTPVAVPGGWKTMGAIKQGDHVFDENGRPTEVTGVTEIFKGHPCYEVEFDSGEIIVCDDAHEWQTTRRARHRYETRKRSTVEILQTLRRPNGIYRSANHSVDLGGALALPEATLPIHPYVLGLWLGDGHRDSARICSGAEDLEHLVWLISDCGYDASARPHGTSWDIQVRALERTLLGFEPAAKASEGNLQSILRSAGLLGNKHIPLGYLRASFEQRLALFQGLMDSDGTISATGTCEFCSIERSLAEQVHELAVSLGLKVVTKAGLAKLYGRVVSDRFRVTFTPPDDLLVFRLPRKIARQKRRHARRRLSGQRMIVDIRPVQSVPVRCIQVAGESHLFLAGRGMIPTGNSGKTPLAGGIGLYMMLADGELSAEIYAAGGKRDQAMRILRDAVTMVDRSPQLRNRLVKHGRNPVWQMTHRPTGSIFAPLSADKQKSGQRVYCGLVDELHEHKDRYTVDMLRAGFKGRRQPLLFVITNSGFDRESICWEWHEHAVAVVGGLREDEKLFAFVMSLDDGDDPLEDESCWAKTNPGIGVTITREYLRGQVLEARQIPGREAGVRRLNFCEWTDAEVGWMTRNAWVSIEEDLTAFTEPPRMVRLSPPSVVTGWPLGGGSAIGEGFEGADLYLGLDLAFTFDLAALAFVFPEGEHLLAWIEYFTPAETAAEREKKDRVPYVEWIKSGLIHGCPGKVIRKEHIAARIAAVSGRYDVRWAAFDRYRHKELDQEMQELGVDVPWIEHPQGFRRGGELDIKGPDGKKLDNPLWMPDSVRALETRVIEKTIRVQTSRVTRNQVSNVAIRDDPAGTGNRIFDKKKAIGHIDGMTALAMAVGAAEMKLPRMNLDGFLRSPVMVK